MRSNTEDQKDKHFVDLPPPTYELALKMMSKESSPEMLPHTAVNLGFDVCWEEMETPGRLDAGEELKDHPFTLTEVSEVPTSSNQAAIF